ncbi:MAG: NADH-quinone oxidoreductase subunit C [Alphaproteobacteria bacterium]
MEESLAEIAEALGAAHPGVAPQSTIVRGELTVSLAATDLIQVVRTLRDDPKLAFVCLVDICGVDWPKREKRFEIVYHLLSPSQNLRIRLKVVAGEAESVPSLSDIFPVADWFEREVYDLFGVFFEGHPDLRRILTDYGFDGYPLRKDFPLTGYVEVHYDDQQRRVVYDKVHLPQEYRDFDFLSPWEGTEYLLPGDEKAKED